MYTVEAFDLWSGQHSLISTNKLIPCLYNVMCNMFVSHPTCARIMEILKYYQMDICFVGKGDPQNT